MMQGGRRGWRVGLSQEQGQRLVVEGEAERLDPLAGGDG